MSSPSSSYEQVPGDADLAAVGALLGSPARCRILLALDDGRALPASRLAYEAGVSAATASSHLHQLVDAGLLTAEPRGRHRDYRLAGPHVAALIEALGRVAPAAPIRSLREGTRAKALRDARSCYDHLAGRLGVRLMASMIDAGLLEGGDGLHHREAAVHDTVSAYGRDVPYRLSPRGEEFLGSLGVLLPARRATVRYCVDWTEQRHHLSGGLGKGLRDRLLELGWVRPSPGSRAVLVTDAGRDGLAEHFPAAAT